MREQAEQLTRVVHMQAGQDDLAAVLERTSAKQAAADADIAQRYRAREAAQRKLEHAARALTRAVEKSQRRGARKELELGHERWRDLADLTARAIAQLEDEGAMLRIYVRGQHAALINEVQNARQTAATNAAVAYTECTERARSELQAKLNAVNAATANARAVLERVEELVFAELRTVLGTLNADAGAGAGAHANASIQLVDADMHTAVKQRVAGAYARELQEHAKQLRFLPDALVPK